MMRPVLIEEIRKNPAVRDAAIVAFADRRVGVGLYAFVESDQTALETELKGELAAAGGPKPPEHIQIVKALPRDASGKPRIELLQLVATNQLDLIETMVTSEPDRAFLKNILEIPEKSARPLQFRGGGYELIVQPEKARERDARHNVHNVSNRDGGRTTKGSLSARISEARSRLT